jgi:hypothetical protein
MLEGLSVIRKRLTIGAVDGVDSKTLTYDRTLTEGLR